MGVSISRFSGDCSLLEGNTPILTSRGVFIRGQR